MIFEQAYGQWIVREISLQLQKINKNLTCKLHDEVGYKPLYYNPDEIAIILSGGSANRSAVKEQDQNILPLTVTTVCKEQYSTYVRDAIDCTQKKWNAVPMQLKYKNGAIANDAAATPITVSVKSIYTTPLVFDESDYATESETIKAAFLSFSATVIYGETAVVEPAEISLKIGTKEYPINHIAETNSASVPSYDSYLPQGAAKLEQRELSRVNSFSYTVYKVAGDELQSLFDEDLNCGDGLFGKELVLVFADGSSIPIKTYQITNQYVNNAAAYNLVLGV